ncbi:hypothetical protein BH20ACT2_BH20ACT2_20030 [soil metagenome]
MDVTPRSIDDRPPARRSRRNLGVGAVVVLVLVAGGIVLAQGLGSATTYFYNADEAVARRAELGERRFRLQGTVVEDAASVGDTDADSDQVGFAVAYGGEEVEVRHLGDPPELFQVGIPVVLEGHWDGTVFDSDQIMVKHSSEYEAENSERLDEADDPDRVRVDTAP